LAPSAITPTVKAISRKPGWSFGSATAASAVSLLAPCCSTNWSTACPAITPSSAAIGPPSAKPAVPPTIFPQIFMAARYATGVTGSRSR
jgi:hypothetical protein